MTLQRRPIATGDDSDRLVVKFSRLLCDYGPSANSWEGTGNPAPAVGSTAGLLPIWTLHRVWGKKIVNLRRIETGHAPTSSREVLKSQG